MQGQAEACNKREGAAAALEAVRARMLELVGSLGLMARVTFETSPYVICLVINSAFTHSGAYAQVRSTVP